MSLARRVLGGAGLMTAAGGLARLLSLLTVPFLSHALGPVPYGVAALAGNVVAIASTLALLGIDMAYARHFLQDDPDVRARVETFCWRFALTGATLAAVIVTFAWHFDGARWLGSDHQAVTPFFAPAILLSVIVIMATTRVRLAGNYRLLAVSVIAAAVAAALVAVGLVLYGESHEWALLAGALAGSVTTLALLGMPGAVALMRRSGLEPGKRRALISLGIAGSVTAPMYWVISSADRWFLAAYVDAAAVGIYSMVANVALAGLMLNSSLTLSWYPEISRAYAQDSADALMPLGKLLGRLIAGLAVVWVCICAIGGDLIRLLTPSEFHVGTPYVPWLAGGVFFYGLATMANTGFFLTNRMRTVAYFWLAGALLSLLLNQMLVPRLGGYGAAVAQCGSFAFIALGIFWSSRGVLRIPVERLRLSICLLLGLAAGALLSSAWADSPLLSLAVKAPVTIVLATAMVGVIAPDWLSHAMRHMLVGAQGRKP